MSDAPSAPKKAVFLSYASQDAEAVARIAEALRAMDVEVWFDKNELRGGDAWDQKIRRQIKECTLFVPVISRTTDARPEGYFRLEWKLAVDRSHLMADDQPFLVPVVIDDTPESTARVPDKFRDVQWTRLVLTETPAAFARRMQDLLGGVRVAGSRRAEEEAQQTRRSDRIFWGRIVPVVAMVFGLIVAVRPGWFWRSSSGARAPQKSAVTAPAEKSVVPPSTKTAPAESEARQLMTRAKGMYELWDGATRDDFAVAEKLLSLALQKDPADGEIWAASSLLHSGQVVLGHDRSAARIEQARDAGERAVRLAPDSIQARLAQAFCYRFNTATAGSVEQMLRELLVKAPDDRMVIRALGATLRSNRKFDEALAMFDRAVALPGGDPVAEHNKFITLQSALRFEEAEKVLDAALAKNPTPYLYRDKLGFLTRLHGDLDGAVEVLKKIPPAFLLEDTGAVWASELWLWRREPEKAIAVLDQVRRDLLESSQFNGPKAFIVGQARAMAGQKAAAETEWRAALQVVEKMNAAQPNVITWVYWKARLYATLGQRAEAEVALKTFEQLAGAKGLTDDTIPIFLLLGRKSEVLDALEKANATLRQRGNAAMLAGHQNNLRFNHEWDLLREEPRFQKLMEK